MPIRYSRKGGRTYRRGGFSFEGLKSEIGDIRNKAKGATTGFMGNVKSGFDTAKGKLGEGTETLKTGAEGMSEKAVSGVDNLGSRVPGLGDDDDDKFMGGKRRGGRATRRGGKRRGGRATRRGGKRRGGRATRRGGKRRGGRRYKGGSGSWASKCLSLGYNKGDGSSSGTTISSSDNGGGTWKDITSNGDGPHPLQATDHNNDGSSSSPTSGSDTKPSGNAWNSSFLGPFSGGPHPSWGAPLNPSSAKITFSGGSRRRGGNPKKGKKSLTMKNKEDFTTKEGNKVFDRDAHYEHFAADGKIGMPYATGGNPKKGKKSLTMKDEEDFTTKKGHKVFDRNDHFEHFAADGKMGMPYMKGGGCGCSGASASSPPPVPGMDILMP